MLLSAYRHERSQSTSVNASPAAVLRFLQHDPEAYLEVAGLHVEKESTRHNDWGEWEGEYLLANGPNPEIVCLDKVHFPVSEDIGLPFAPRTRFRIRWQATSTGARWESWAKMNVYVKNSFELRQDLPSRSPASTIVEVASLRCPVYIFPLVKLSFLRAHHRLHAAIQQHFDQMRQPDLIK